MASCQLQRPAEQTCNQKTNENSSGHKVPDMVHKAMCTSEHKQSEQKVMTCQTQTTAQQQVTAKPQTHCTGKVHSHQNGHGEAGSGQHGGHGMAAGLKEKIHEGKKKVKSLFKRKDRNGGSGGGSSSSSESESDDEPCHCPKKD